MTVRSDSNLGSGTSATSVSGVGVTGELHLLAGRKLKNLLDPPAHAEEGLLALLGGATLAASHVTVTAARNGLADATRPDTNTVEGLADIDDHTHDLAIVLVLQGVADSGQHDVQPQLVDVDAALGLELV